MTKAADGEVPYTDEKLVAAADKIAEWAEKGYFGEGITTVDMNTAGSMLMSGKAAIFYNGSWFTQNLTDDSQNPAGEDGIGFFNIPVADESISSATSYSMNCGNILALDNDKYDEATGWFLKYFMEIRELLKATHMMLQQMIWITTPSLFLTRLTNPQKDLHGGKQKCLAKSPRQLRKMYSLC